MSVDLDSLKPYLLQEIERTTHKTKGGLYACPFPSCDSGTGENGTGALSIEPDGLHCKCFSCGRGGDIFDYVALTRGLSLQDATRAVIREYGSGLPGASSTRGADAGQSRPHKKEQPAGGDGLHVTTISRPDCTDKVEKWAAAMPGSAGESYLQGRGFTPETIARCKMGYDPMNGYRGGRIIVPYLEDGKAVYYAARYLTTGPNDGKPWRKPDAKDVGTQEPVFNVGELYAANVVFIVESQLCALSIQQAGGHAVALNGTGGEKLVRQLKKKPSKAAFIVALDNDEPGRTASQKILEDLDKLGCTVGERTAELMGDCKDPNEVLSKQGTEALATSIQSVTAAFLGEIQDAAAEKLEERRKRTGAGMVESFLQAIQTHKYKPMPTGIADIDKAIGGGFIRQQLILLGAAPGAGKTALAQWIFEGMAKSGEASCVYLNLEMSREQVLARSLSRIAARQGNRVTPNEVLQGYKWTEAQRDAVEAAAVEYKNAIAPRMIYNPDGLGADLDAIMAYLEQEAEFAESAGEKAPAVVVDYMQLIRGKEREDDAAIIKRAVSAFKGYAMKHDTIVFSIIAHNRETNKGGNPDMNAGRDTSALEYSADLQLALAYTMCVDGIKKAADLTEQEKAYVTLKVTKGRFGGGGKSVDLYFSGETMTYTQIDKRHTASSAERIAPCNEPETPSAWKTF